MSPSTRTEYWLLVLLWLAAVCNGAVCTVTDGSAVSSSYPCDCGTASCTSGQKCTSASNSCTGPDGTSCQLIKFEAMDFSGSPCLWQNVEDHFDGDRQYIYGRESKYKAVDSYPHWNLFTCDLTDDRECSICNSTGCTTQTSTISDTGYYATVNTTGLVVEQYGRTEALQAKTYYESFSKALDRYDCTSSFKGAEAYSYWNCDDCRKAYARWLCSQTVPGCSSATSAATKPCIQVCHDVMIKCPISLDFRCPETVSYRIKDYWKNDNPDCEWMGISQGIRLSTTATFIFTTSILASLLFNMVL